MRRCWVCLVPERGPVARRLRGRLLRPVAHPFGHLVYVCDDPECVELSAEASDLLAWIRGEAA
jgi:hypothetical protein